MQVVQIFDILVLGSKDANSDLDVFLILDDRFDLAFEA